MMVLNGERTIRVLIVRGGSSKAIVLLRKDLPVDPEVRDKVILSLFGSPDVRQIDGLAGAQNLTSKLAIIGPPTRKDADVDYLFGQVQITKAYVDYNANCGNISSAIGPAAIHYGLVDPIEPKTTIKIHQVNTKSIIQAEVPVRNGHAEVQGDYVVDGVPGSGAHISLDFSDSAGAILKKGLLPTKKTKEQLEVAGIGKLTVSIVDAANLVVFIRAEDVGLTGNESIIHLEQDHELIDRLESIRGTAAEYTGFLKDWKSVDFETFSNPYLALVKRPNPYALYTTNKVLDATEYHLYARLFANKLFHRAYPGTGTVATGIASKIDGSIVADLVAPTVNPLRIGHPAGTIEVAAQVERAGTDFMIREAAYGRTARILIDGYAFLRPDVPFC